MSKKNKIDWIPQPLPPSPVSNNNFSNLNTESHIKQLRQYKPMHELSALVRWIYKKDKTKKVYKAIPTVVYINTYIFENDLNLSCPVVVLDSSLQILGLPSLWDEHVYYEWKLILSAALLEDSSPEEESEYVRHIKTTSWTLD